MDLLDGKVVKKYLLDDLRIKLNSSKISLVLAIIQINNRDESNIYVRNKIRLCMELGINYKLYSFDEMTSEKDIIEVINKLNMDNNINGIILQLPIPDNLDKNRIINSIIPSKDIDGLTIDNINRLKNNDLCLIPCTARSVFDIIDYYEIDVKNKNVVILGKSDLVGRPIKDIMIRRGAVVSVVDSKTEDISLYTKCADVIVTSVGKKNIINVSMIKDNVIIIDCGFSIDNGKIVGDVNFDDVLSKVKYITPVPGGVGQVTVVEVFRNLYDAKNYLLTK